MSSSKVRFDKLLIANRGEIVIRIARTARRMGIATVAVYSDADQDAAHVRACDEAVYIGAAPATESYLRSDAIIEAAHQTGARAIHPGYGFLSENAAFARACERAQLTFVGPPPDAIERVGSKAAAKDLARSAAVPMARGYHGEDQSAETLQRQASAVGLPLLIKPVAGGGGKGMRRVTQMDEFAAALQVCQREALRSFGDDRVLLEQYVAPARHVEVQVLADAHGNYVHLFDRDCSAQRRHQKVMEEAPAPGLTAEQRAEMSKAAIAIARAAGYASAGTVEFLVGPDGAFYFLEMNTRLQVEHGVTELITGLDLVEWQLRIARGETLPFAQHEVKARGHAMEVRLCAEDPAAGFLPAAGRIERLQIPLDEGIRVDAGFRSGDEISPYYDSLLVKIMAAGSTREEALARLTRTLAHSSVLGILNNREFLQRLLELGAVASGQIDTGMIEREQERLTSPAPAAPRLAWLLAALAALQPGPGERALGASPGVPWRSLGAWRLSSEPSRGVRLRYRQQTEQVLVRRARDGMTLELHGEVSHVRAWRNADGAVSAEIDGREYPARSLLRQESCHVYISGGEYLFTYLDPLGGTQSAEGAEHSLRSPLPGRVIAVLVQPGAAAERGMPLIVIEAMKMEHTVTAPGRGVVTGVHFVVGDHVSAGASLLDFEPSEAQETPGASPAAAGERAGGSKLRAAHD